MLSLKDKQRFARMLDYDMTPQQIYDRHIDELGPIYCDFRSFARQLRKWRQRAFLDEEIVDGAKIDGSFFVHDATVQVNGRGEVTQAWIKQKASDLRWEEMLTTIREEVKPVFVEPVTKEHPEGMLEIPLFDMHFGIADYDYYTSTLNAVIQIIKRRARKQVNILLGQDLFHNDDFRGRTSSGRQIEQVDMPKAWRDARLFMFAVITACLQYCPEDTRLWYTMGNHDESFCWAFVQMIKVAFPALHVDDSTKRRKCISWEGCFIGFEHGNETKSANNDIRGAFTIKFPLEFANAQVREIHCGHLHHEREADVYGVMIRRLSSGNKEDSWSDKEGFIGAHKRFTLFEWEPGRLRAIHYV